jgi:hypothetical protein
MESANTPMRRLLNLRCQEWEQLTHKLLETNHNFARYLGETDLRARMSLEAVLQFDPKFESWAKLRKKIERTQRHVERSAGPSTWYDSAA